MGREKTVEHDDLTDESSVQRLGIHSILSTCNPTVSRDVPHIFSFPLSPRSVLELTCLLPMVLVILLLGAAIPAGAGEALDDLDVTLEPDNQAIVHVGRSVYQSHCASCHGKQLEGQANWRQRLDNGMLPAPPHDKSGHTWHHADDLLFEITKYGMARVVNDPNYLTMMPLFEPVLEDREIIAVLSYIKSTWPAEERAWQEKVNKPNQDGFDEVKKKSWLDRWINQ